MNQEITTLWEKFRKELKVFVLNKIRNPADAEDLLQDVFVKIISNIDKINQAHNLRQYLYGIVRNTVNDYFRNQKNNSKIPEPLEFISEDEAQSLNETIAENCLKPFIDTLPLKYREALWMAEFDEVSQKDLAGVLNISYSGAKSRVQRGREKLKELLLNCCAYQSDKYGNLLDLKDNPCGCP